jgi:hypothetical protein
MGFERLTLAQIRENLRGKYHCTVDLLYDWFVISCMTIDIFCFYLQNRLIQTSQMGGQWYSDTSPFSIPFSDIPLLQSMGLTEESLLKGKDQYS